MQPSVTKRRVRFEDEDGRQVLLELTSAGVVHCYMNGRHKVNRVTRLHAAGRTLHIEGKRLLTSGCTATIPPKLADGRAAEEVICNLMELFGQRAPGPHAPRNSRRLAVWIVSARGLRNADGLPSQGTSDPYCTCEVVGKPSTKQSSAFMKNTCSPTWNHICEIDEWCPGDVLLFTVWDKDWCSRDDFLGRAELAPQSDLPEFEGELRLAKAGPGAEAFLRVRVVGGTRHERAVGRLRSDLRRAAAPDEADPQRDLAIAAVLEEARALGLPTQDQSGARQLLAAIDGLQKACAEGDAEHIREAVEVASALGLGGHRESARARQLLALMELNAACMEHRGIPPLELALAAAKQAGLEAVETTDAEELLHSLRPLRDARREDDAHKVVALVKEACICGLNGWPEFVEAQEHAQSLVVAQMSETCRTPSILKLEEVTQLARDAQLDDADVSRAAELLDALRTLTATLEAFDAMAGKRPRTETVATAAKRGRAETATAPDSSSSQPLRSAVARARGLAISEGSCAEFAGAIGRLREVARAAIQGAATRAELRAAIDLGEEVWLERVELAEAEHVLQVKNELEVACVKRKEEGLRTAIVSADLASFDKAKCAEYQKAKMMLLAHEQLREARMESKDAATLQAAIEAAKAVGLGQAEIAATGDVLTTLKLERTVREKLAKAIQAKRWDVLEQAMDSAEFMGLQCCDEYLIAKRMMTVLSAAEAVRLAMAEPPLSAKELSFALNECGKLGLEDKTRKVPKEVLQTVEEGKQKLADLIAERRRLDDVCGNPKRAELADALKSAREVGLGGADTRSAEELLETLVGLAKVAESGDVEQLRAAVEQCGGGPLANTSEFYVCKDKLKTEEARLAVARAMASRDLEEVRKALKVAKEANLPKHEQQGLEDILDQLQGAMEREWKNARQQLQDACQHGTTIAQLEEALRQAHEASLPEEDLDIARARELCTKRKEALRMLDRAITEKELIKAIDRASNLGMETYPEFIDAKKQFDMKRETSKRNQHLEQARRDLEKAVQKGKKEPLERAIRQARVLDIDPMEIFFKLAQSKLKEIMSGHIARLCKKVELGLREGTLDRTRLDHMSEAKDELVSSLRTAKSLHVHEVDLREIERLRKMLHNIVEDLKGSIRVFCRVRPLSGKEKAAGETDAVKQTSPMTLEVGESKQSVEGRSKREIHRFTFDAVFTPGTQEAIFADCRELVQSALDGYNVTIFAYGQTGAGKTYTMTGEPAAEGIAPCTVDAIYGIMDMHCGKVRYDVKASIVELYCNRFTDLLAKKTADNIEVKYDKENGEVVVEGVVEEVCRSAKELRGILARGQESRRVAQTQMNHESSRSHLLMMIKISSTNLETREVLKGKIVLVDLAGSERLKKSKPSPQQQTEAIEINKSLTALVDVIEALVHHQRDQREGKPARFIPYRNHKLTQLLQDTLGGPSKALMIVNCSPAASSAQETLSSLRYASRAKTITNQRQHDDGGLEPVKESRPLMARLRTVRSAGDLHNDLKKFKTFNSDDELELGERGRAPTLLEPKKARTVRFSSSLEDLERARTKSNLG